MIKLKMEHIKIKIQVQFELSPRTIVSVNQNVVFDQKINHNEINLEAQIDNSAWSLGIRHSDKDYIESNNEFIEVKNIFLNDVSVGKMLWNTVQVPTDIDYNEMIKHNWKGNLFLGHNSYCIWNFTSPVETMLRNYYKTNSNKTMNAQETTQETLDYMKQKFNITN